MKKLFLNRHTGVFIFIVAGFILLFLSVVYLYSETDIKYETITHYKETTKKFDQLLSSCYEMEATARGYSLTNDMSVADTYNEAKNNLKKLVISIDSVRSVNELETATILEILVKERVGLLDSQMTIIDSLETLSETGKFLIIEGDVVMDKIRASVSSLKQNLTSRINEEQKSLRELKNNTFTFIILSVLFASIFIMISYYRLVSLSESHEQQKIVAEEQKILLEEAENISNCGSWKWDLVTNETPCSNGTYKIFEIDPKVETIDFEVFTDIIHPEDRERIGQEITDGVTKGVSYMVEHRIITRDNKEKIVQSIGRPKIDENGAVTYFGSIRDITLLKAQESELEEQKQLLEEAEKISSCGSWKWDLETNETVCSEGTYKIFEIDSKEETINFEVFTDIVHPNDRERIGSELTEATSKGVSYVIEHRIITRKNNLKVVQSIGKPKTDEKGVLSYYGSIRDITLLKAQENELIKQNEELITLNENLQQFTYIASHDLQEPLRKIQTFAMLLKEQYEEEAPGLEYVNRMQNASERMRSLISDLLDFSRVSRNVGEGEKVNLNGVVNEVLENFDISNIEFQLDELPRSYRAHRTQMIQLFQNLISNAIKFKQEKQQQKLAINCEVINEKVEGIETRTCYEISIKDNGIGFDSSYADKIFDMFQRLHSRNEYPGTGIGLAICKKIVENHEGVIKVNSKLGLGSEFKIYLPIIE